MLEVYLVIMKIALQTILLILLGSLLVNCKEEPSNVAIIEPTTVGIDSITIRATQGLKPELRLTPAAREAVKDWNMYTALEKMMAEYKAITFANLKTRVTQGVQLFVQQEQAEEAAVKLVPDHIDTPAINARLLVLETRLRVLESLTQKYEPNLERIETEMIALQNAFQELNLQINERFAKSVEELLEELRKSQEEEKGNTPQRNPQGRPPLSISEQF